MADLPTNYYDDILSASMNGKKKFRLTYRNGTTEEVTIEDISEYDQYGSKFGAGDINKTNQAVNEKFDSDDVVDPMLATVKGFAADAFLTGKELKKQEDNLTASNGMPFKFGINENGEYGYIVTDEEGADTVHPFKNLVRDTQANAVADTITEGFCAWVNGELIWGTRPAPINSQTGTIGIGYMSQDSQTSVVTFEKIFDTIPTVTVSNVFTNNGEYCTGYRITNVTERGFTITFMGTGGGGKGIFGTCTWYARV
jgi:hypothetical protein